jgi:hypothetical protein
MRSLLLVLAVAFSSVAQTFQIITPTDGSVQTALSIFLSWTKPKIPDSNDVYFSIFLSPDGVNYTRVATVNSTSFVIQKSTLVDKTVYACKIIYAINVYYDTERVSFLYANNVDTTILHYILRLISPVNYAKLKSTNVTFVWHSVPNANRYHIDITYLLNGKFKEISDYVRDTSYNVTLDTNQYSWLIQAYDSIGRSAELHSQISDMWIFYTPKINVTSILTQTKIRTITRQSNSRIFDIRGRIVSRSRATNIQISNFRKFVNLQ